MVIYPPEKVHLIKLYSLMESEVPIDSWPPVGNSTLLIKLLINRIPSVDVTIIQFVETWTTF